LVPGIRRKDVWMPTFVGMTAVVVFVAIATQFHMPGDKDKD
jgi:hypothetical protein